MKQNRCKTALDNVAVAAKATSKADKTPTPNNEDIKKEAIRKFIKSRCH